MDQTLASPLANAHPKVSVSQRWMVPAALLGISLLAYGVFIPWFGLYGDDWVYLHNFHTLGALSFNQFVAVDRPYSGWIYILTTPIFGEQAWPYHVFLLALRWMSAVLLWYTLRLVWPRRTWALAWVAALFLVYPGFQQQPIAVQYILHFSLLDLLLVSLASMLLAAMARPGSRRFWALYAVSVVTSLALFSMEYFAGLELLRPVLLWMALGQAGLDGRARLKRTLMLWSPFIAVLLAFGLWRIFIFQFPTYEPVLLNGLMSSPRATLAALAKRIVSDLLKVNFGAWRLAFGLPGKDGSPAVFGLIVAGAGGLSYALLRSLGRTAPEAPAEANGETSRREWPWPLQAMLLGGYAMLIAGLPFWFAMVPLELSFPWDRSTLPFMLGACLLVVGAVDALIRPHFQPVLLAALVAFSAGFQYRNALVYRGEQEALNAYFYQLAWRAPALKPGAIVASDAIPLWRFSDNDLTPVLNWMYAPGERSNRLVYQYFDLSLRLGTDIREVKPGLPVKHGYRNFSFRGNTSDVLAVFTQPAGCLHVLTAEDGWQPGLPKTVREVLPISNLAVIQANGPAAQLPAAIGSEPVHGWCYYYEKADLARQQGDWQSGAALGDKAQAMGLQAKEALEWLPFIEAYAHSGDWQQARDLSDRANEPDTQPGLCAVWQRVSQSTGAQQAAEALSEYDCGS